MSRHANGVYARLDEWFDSLSGDYVTTDEVRRFIAHQQADPELAKELAAFANVLIYNALACKAAKRRTMLRWSERREQERQAIRPRIVTAAENVAAGRPSGLFEQRFKVDDKGTMRAACEMNGADHLVVAGQYVHHSKRNGLFAAFHKAVAKKCGAKRTDEVFTADQYEAMYRSIVVT